MVAFLFKTVKYFIKEKTGVATKQLSQKCCSPDLHVLWLNELACRWETLLSRLRSYDGFRHVCSFINGRPRSLMGLRSPKNISCNLTSGALWRGEPDDGCRLEKNEKQLPGRWKQQPRTRGSSNQFVSRMKMMVKASFHPLDIHVAIKRVCGTLKSQNGCLRLSLFFWLHHLKRIFWKAFMFLNLHFNYSLTYK